MRMRVFAIRDLAVGAFAPPFLARANGEAIRMFQEHMRKQVQPENAKDYVLYYLGEYDDIDGKFDNNQKPIVLDTTQKRGTIETTKGPEGDTAQ